MEVSPPIEFEPFEGQEGVGQVLPGRLEAGAGDRPELADRGLRMSIF
jgi:hypothetical protein